MIDKAREVADLKRKIEQYLQEKNFLLLFPVILAFTISTYVLNLN